MEVARGVAEAGIVVLHLVLSVVVQQSVEQLLVVGPNNFESAVFIIFVSCAAYDDRDLPLRCELDL